MKESLVTKLVLRETRGTMQPHLRGNRLRFFKKCPQRFCIPLESVLDLNGAIKKGHVILGFTKNGRYLISYRLKIDSDDSSPLPCYVYSLHWWEFNPHKPLVEVFSVPLFDKEEIHQDLHLIVAQSQDESTLVVYGEIHSIKDEYDQSHQCYVTVSAGPAPRPCPGCKYTSLGKIADMCLKHSFVVHFKYDLMPPFPMFNPALSLKMGDQFLFNTGDFLMILKVLNFDNDNDLLTELNDFSEDQHYQTQVFCKSCVHATGRTAASFQSSAAKDFDKSDSEEEISENQICNEIHKTHHSVTDLMGDASSQENDKFVQHVSGFNKVSVASKGLDQKKVVLGFARELNEIHGDCNSHQVFDREYSSTSRRTVEARGLFDGQTSLQSADNRESDQMTVGCRLFQSSETSLKACCSINETETVVPETICSTAAKTSPRSTLCNKLGDSSPPETAKKDTCIDYNSNSDLDPERRMAVIQDVSHSCSCDCNVILPTMNNNLTLSALKIYTEPGNNSLVELPDGSDEFDMYDGSLPVTVKTCRGKTLKQIGSINQSNPQMASSQLLREKLSKGICFLGRQRLAVHQMTLDLEQCIGELIQAHDGLRDCYKSLRDYDVQLLNVFPDSHQVVIMARILVYTHMREKSTSCGLPVSPSPVLQCTGFIFSWDVCTGGLRILQVLDLETCSEQKKYEKFNMASKETRELRAKLFIPQSISSYVQAFSNHTVFTGKSLKYLRHPFLPLVLVL